MAKKYLIALDDGHGLNTSGKRTPTLPNGTKSEIGRDYMNENLFNRAVIGYLKEELERNGFDTLEVAPTDADTSLKKRTDLANNTIKNDFNRRADVFVSVHANAYLGKFGTHGGIDTFHYPNSTSGKKLANMVHAEVIQGSKLANRGIKERNFHVLRETWMPAILCELGFMDSLNDYKYLLNEDYRRECAREIARGLCHYFNRVYQAPEPEQPIYRVFIDDRQIFALRDKTNIIKQLQKHIGTAKEIKLIRI